MIAATEPECFDVVIAGGGPAGSAAGLTLLKRPGTRVAVIEATGYEPPRLGEALTPGVRPLLEYLDLWEPFRRGQSIEAYGSLAAWGSPVLNALDYMFTLHGSGWNLDRCAFDRLLAEAFAARGGSLCLRARLVACRPATGGGWDLQMRTEVGDRWLRCRRLIDATGRAASLARRLGARRRRHDRLAGVARIGRVPDGRALQQVTLVEACAYGWWYSAPVPGGRMSVVLMSDADEIRRLAAARTDRWETLLAETEATRERAAGLAFDGGPVVRSAESARLDPAGGPGWVAVGDAVASHDPLSSSGIPHAIGSAVQGAIVTAAALDGTSAALAPYGEGIEADYRRYLETRWRYYRREGRWPEAAFWRRRREEIRLDPMALVTGCRGSVGGSVHLEAHLARDLLGLCRPGLALHAIARAFVDAHPEVPDERAILGLQELAADGRLATDRPPMEKGPAFAGPHAMRWSKSGQEPGLTSPTST